MDDYTQQQPFDANSMAPPMALALSASFGSPQRWHEAYLALAAVHAGAGQVLLVYQPREGRLVQRWAADGVPNVSGAGGEVLILTLHLSGSGAPAERAAGIAWDEVYSRYQQAVEHASAACGAAPDEIEGALLLDVRRDAMYRQSPVLIPGAEWRDPAAVGNWAGSLPAGREVVVYCIYGHEVGRATALRLRAAGISARYLRGGIDAWQSAGLPLQAKRAAA